MDSRIVQMVFENGNFEKNIHESIKSLELLEEALKMGDSKEQLSQLEKAENEAAHTTQKAAKTGLDAISTLSLAIYRVKNDIAGYFVDMGKSALNFSKQLTATLTTMDQWREGFNKYEQKTKAVQTIQSALPDVDFSTITGALDELNWYSDMTSYSFTDMTESLGKFVAAGIDLETAVGAIEGINNEAAKSGASIAQANAAMYNFSQSLSQGSVRLMDWKSIENATMATKEFKEQIIESAVELGTLQRRGDQVFAKNGALVDFRTFSSTLSQGWFTSDVLIDVLNKYADLDSEFGKTAFDAARVSRTFSDAWTALKDATSSGWMQSFELIFGDLNEAIDLWTRWGDAVIDATSGISEWRNGILQGWRDLGGREAMITGLEGVFTGLWNILVEVKNAFAEVFPVDFSQVLANMSTSVEAFGEKFKQLFGYRTEWVKTTKQFVAQGSHVARAFSGEILELGARGDDVKKLQEYLNELGYELSVDGVFGKQTQAALIDFQRSVDGATQSVFTLSRTDFKMGEASKEVAALQARLVELGYLSEEQAAEGVFNLDTKEAFDAYKQSLDYVMDVEHQLGDKGEDIRALQEELIQAGFLTDESGADGIYGPKTKAALEAYRRNASEAIEGVYDETTHLNLMEALDSKEGIDSYVEKTVLEPVDALGVGLQTVKTIAKGVLTVISLIGKVAGIVLKVAFTGIGLVLKLLSPVLNLFVDILASVSSFLTLGGELITEGGLFEGIVSAIAGAFDWLQGVVEGAVKAVRRFLGLEGEVDENGEAIFTIGKLWRSFIDTLKSTGAVEALVNAWDRVKKAFAQVKEKIKEVFSGDTGSAAWEVLKSVLTTIAEVLGGILAVVIMGLAKLVSFLVPLIGKLPKVFKAIKNFVGGIWKQFGMSKRIQDFTKRVGNFGKSIYEFFFGKDIEDKTHANPEEQLNEHVPGLIEKVWKWVNESEAIQNAIEGVKNFFKTVFEFFFGKDEEDMTMANPEERVTNHIPGFIETAWTWLHESEAIQNFIDSAKNIFKSIREFFFGKDIEDKTHANPEEQLNEHVPGFFENVWTWLHESEAIQNFIDSAKSVFQSVKEFLFGKDIEHMEKANPEEQLEHVPGLFEKIWNWISDGERIESIVNTAKSVFQSIKEFLFGKDIEHMERANPEEQLEHVDGVFDKISKFYDKVRTAIADSEALQNVLTFLKGIWESIKTFFTQDLPALPGQAAEGASNVFSDVIGFLSGIWDSVVNFFTSDTFKSLPANAIETIKPIVSSVVEGVVWLVNNLAIVLDVVSGQLLKLFRRLVPVIAAVTTLMASVAVNNVAKAAKNFAKAAKVYAKSLNNAKKADKWENIGDAIKQVVLGLAVVFGFIVWLSTVADKNRVGDAIGTLITVLGIIIGAIVLLLAVRIVAVKLKVGNIFEGLGETFKGLAAALASMALCIIIFSSMDIGAFLKGLFMTGLVLMVLGAFVAGIGKHKGESDVKQVQWMAVMLLAMVAAVAVLGQLQIDALLKGLVAVGILTLFMRGLVKTLGKYEIKTSHFLKPVLGVISLMAAFTIMTGFLGAMGIGQLAAGLFGMNTIVGAIKKVLDAFGKLRDVKIDKSVIFGILSVFAGIAGIIVALGYAISLTQGVSAGQVAAFMLPLAVCVGLAATVMHGLKRTKDMNWSQIVSLALPLFAIAAIVIALGVALKLAQGASPDQMLMFAVPLAVVIGVTAVVMHGLKRLGEQNTNWSKILAYAVPLFAIAAIVIALGYAMRLASGVNVWQILSFAVALLALIPTVALVMIGIKMLSRTKMSAGKLAALALPLLAIGGILVAMGYAMSLAKDLDEKQMTGFAKVVLALGPALAGLGVFMKLVGSLGWEGLGVALVGIIGGVVVIGLLIAAIGGLMKIPAVKDFMSGAVEDIGELFGKLVGSFMGAMKAAELKSMAKGLNDLSEVPPIDEAALDNVLGVVQKVVDFENGLPEVSTVDKIINWVTGGGPLAQLGKDMTSFGAGINNFATYLGEVDSGLDDGTLSEKTTAAIGIAQQVADFEAGLQPLTITEGIFAFLGVGSPLARLSTDLGNFASGFTSYATQMSGLEITEGLEEKTTDAIGIAKQIADLEAGLTPLTITEGIFQYIGLGSPITRLSNDLGNFAAGFNNYVTQMDKVEIKEGLDEKTTTAIDVATSIVDLKNGMTPLSTIIDGFLSMFKNGSPISRLSTDMSDFASGFNDFTTKMAEVKEVEGLDDKTDTAIEIATQIVKLKDGMSLDDTIIDALLLKIGKKSKIGSLASDMGDLASGFNTYATEMGSISDELVNEDFDKKSEAAIKVATSIANLKDSVSGSSTSFDTFLGIFGANSFSQFLGQLPQFATDMDSFVTAMDNVSVTEEDLSKAQQAVDVAGVVADFMAKLGGSEIEGDKSAIGRFFSGETNLNTFFTKIDDLTQNIDKLKTSFVGLTDANLEGEWETVESVLTGFLDFVTNICQEVDGTSKARLDTTNFDDLLGNLGSLLTTIEDFYNPSYGGGTAGTEAFTSMVTGFSTFVTTLSTSSEETITKGVSMISNHKQEFYDAGSDLMNGLANGIKDHSSTVYTAIETMAEEAVKKAKLKFDEHSPSKVFEQIGKFLDLGLVNGVNGEESTVLSTIGRQCDAITDLFSSMDADAPVIRPVLDLSGVSAAAKGIDPLIGSGRTIDVSATATRTREAAEAGRSRTVHNNQNGNGTSSQEAGGSVLITGNSFNIQNESDIDVLASKIAALLHSQQRGYGAAL